VALPQGLYKIFD
jgi:DNA topoisomerase-2